MLRCSDHLHQFKKVQVQTFDKRTEWINLVVPLSGRVETFQQFMEMFCGKIASKKDQKVFLTVVYFGEEGKEEARQILGSGRQRQSLFPL